MRGEVTVAPFSAPCSELPNDNPALHEGAVWVSMTPTGRPRAVSRPPRVEPPRAVEVEPPPPAVQAPAPAETPDGFRQLVSLLGRVALASGATRAAALLPSFLDGQVVELGDALGGALVASGHAAASGSGFVMSESVASTTRAWRALLSGQSEDLSSCEETLDAWCAGLVAALSGTPARANELRRELRRFGVAAFGLLADAA